MTENNKYKPGDLAQCRVCGHNVKVVGYRFVPTLNKDFLITSDCEFCLKQEKLRKEKLLKSALRKAGLGEQYVGLRFEDLEDVSSSFAKAKQSAINYCKAIHVCKKRGLGIYFYGDNGRGKTALTSCILRNAANHGFSVYSLTLTELVEKLFKKELSISFLNEVDFLSIEDIGSERLFKSDNDGTFLGEKATEIIASREKDLKPTLFTSNLKISELARVGYPKKTIERITSLSSRVFEVEAKSSFRLRKIEDLPF